MKVEDEFDFTNAIKNPFAGMMKKGYSVTVHHPPYEERQIYTYEEVIEEEMKTFKYIICEKTKDMSREQLVECLDKIFKAIKAV